MANSAKSNMHPPRLVIGLIGWLFVTLGLFVAGSWSLLNVQIEKLMRERTSEYAHNIAAISAALSSVPMQQGNLQQLEILLQHTTSNPHIISATIYRDSGEIVAQYPQPPTLTEDETDQASGAGMDASQFLVSTQNKPFIESITTDERTIGWFKVVLNQQSLEKEFRAELLNIEIAIGLFSVILFLILGYRIYKHSRLVRSVVKTCHRFVCLSDEVNPTSKTEWFSALAHIQDMRLPALHQFPHADELKSEWQSVSRISDTVFVNFTFELIATDTSSDMEQVKLAESMLNESANSLGLQFQGEILSGCIALISGPDSELEKLSKALSLAILLNSLLHRLTLKIHCRSVITKGELLLFEDDKTLVTAVTPLKPAQSTILGWLSAISNDQICIAGNFACQFESIAEFEPISSDDKASELLRLVSPNNELLSVVAHQASHIARLLNV